MQVLIREGTYAQISGQIYLMVVQSVLLYGSEAWGMTPRIGWGVEMIPPQGGPQADREATSEREGWSVDIPPNGKRNGGSGTA